jgi:hypothetical protein
MSEWEDKKSQLQFADRNGSMMFHPSDMMIPIWTILYLAGILAFNCLLGAMFLR